MREICQSGFDERGQEPESSQTGLRRRRESAVNRHRETKATAPVLDSTPNITQNGSPFQGRGFIEKPRELLFVAGHYLLLAVAFMAEEFDPDRFLR